MLFHNLKIELKKISINTIEKITPEIAPLIVKDVLNSFSPFHFENQPLNFHEIKYPEGLDYDVYKNKLSGFVDSSINNLKLEHFPNIATGMTDISIKLERGDFLPTNISCPNCNHVFLGYKNSTNVCLKCSHTFFFTLLPEIDL